MQGKVKDMDFKNLKEDNKTSIAGIYEMPLPIINPGNQTYNNYAEAEVNYYKNSLLPPAEFVIEFLSIIFEVKFEINKSSIPALQKDSMKVTLDMSNAGVFSVNECRNKAGYGDIVGGEQIFRPSSEIPIGDDGDIEDQDGK